MKTGPVASAAVQRDVGIVLIYSLILLDGCGHTPYSQEDRSYPSFKGTSAMLGAELRQQVLAANVELARAGLVILTFGNASGICRESGLVAIKPSGVPFENLTAETIVVTDLDGHVREGALRPSSDLRTHLLLYREFPEIGGVVHTHSRFATAWVRAGREIPCFGTTHADYFRDCVPITEPLSEEQIASGYERNTGLGIVRRLAGSGVLVAGHRPFCWGVSPQQAVQHALLLGEIAALAYHTMVLNPEALPLGRALHNRHFDRKHGCNAYYS